MRKATAGLGLAVALGGCLSARDATVSIAYAPQSLAESPYNLRVGDFTRTLLAGIAPNQYETSGYTFNKQISLSEPLADYLKNAFVQEVRRAGASLRGEPACTVSAGIDHMQLISGKGTKLTWTDTLAYHVDAGSGAVLDVPVTASVDTSANSAEAGHTQFIGQTVDGLLRNAGFASFAKAHCPRTGTAG